MKRGRPRFNPRDPKTSGEWQEAVNAAEFLLALDSCQQYGLIEGGPKVDQERAVELLSRGKRRGFRPLPLKELVQLYIG